MIGEHRKPRTVVGTAGMWGMATMRKNTDAAAGHQWPEEDITLNPLHRNLIVEKVVITMILSDGDGSHLSLRQSRPYTVSVQIRDDSGAGTGMALTEEVQRIPME